MENAEWRAARADYEAGMKRKAICEKYGCTYTALDNDGSTFMVPPYGGRV